MSTKISINEDALEAKIQFWVREGILQETQQHQYKLNEQGSCNDNASE